MRTIQARRESAEWFGTVGVGTILSPGRRTVASALRVIGHEPPCYFAFRTVVAIVYWSARAASERSRRTPHDAFTKNSGSTSR